MERRRDRLTEELNQARKSGRFAQTALQTSYDPDEDDLDDLSAEGEGEGEDAISGASTAKTSDELAREIEHLSGLIKLAVRTRDKGPERKLMEFQQAIESAICGGPHREDTSLHRA